MSKVLDFRSPFKGEVRGRIRDILLFDNEARDNGILLYLSYLQMYHNLDRKKTNINELFSLMVAKEIPTMEYVCRVKRDLQNKHKELRGAKYGGEL